MKYLYDGLIKLIAGHNEGKYVLMNEYLGNMLSDYQVGVEIPAYKIIISLVQSKCLAEILSLDSKGDKVSILEKAKYYANIISDKSSLKRDDIKYVLDCII